jgi:hypothetical protein
MGFTGGDVSDVLYIFVLDSVQFDLYKGSNKYDIVIRTSLILSVRDVYSYLILRFAGIDICNKLTYIVSFILISIYAVYLFVFRTYERTVYYKIMNLQRSRYHILRFLREEQTSGQSTLNNSVF